jgi:predicted restriction endonuclease
MVYQCEFPFCNYETKVRNKIHKHHIIPKELGGNNNKSNLIFLCPTCHSKIFIEKSLKGQHSILDNDSIIIIGKKLSTNGMVLHYYNKDKKETFYFYNLKEILEL